MAEMEDKLGAILNNPQMMQQIMTMAQSLGESQQTDTPEPKQSPKSMEFDPAMLQKMAALASKGNIDSNQRALLNALHPYLSRQKVRKLEKAMQAARMARMASSFLGQGGLTALNGR